MPSTHTEPPRHERQHGDEHHLFATHSLWLRRALAAKVYTSDANLEDACSFAWLKLLSNQPRRETVLGWLLKVATHEAYRLHRLGIDQAPVGEWLEQTPQKDEAPIGDEGLRTLHPRRRGMLVLHAAGYTNQEIAAAYGITLARASKLICTARRQLRERTDLAE